MAERAAVVAAALGKFAARHTDRDAMPDDAEYNVDIAIAAKVDGEPYTAEIAAGVHVGRLSTRASSVGHSQDHLIAAILAKLNTTTRDKVLRDLPDEFERVGGLPPVTDEALAAVEAFRKRLRAKVSQQVRGSVKVDPIKVSVPE